MAKTFSQIDPLVGPLSGDESFVGIKPSGSESDDEDVLISLDDVASYVLSQDSNTGGGGGNAFGTIAVSGQSDVVADSANDTLTLVAGSNITLTTNAGSDSVTIAASGGGGGSTSTAAYASRPAVGNDGNLFFPNNSFYIERDNGSIWQPWGPIFPMTPLVDGDFSWVNQGTASVVTTYGGIYLSTTAVSGANIRIRTKTAPSAPYTITAAFTPLLYGVNYNACGIGFRQSGTGELHLFTFVHDNDWVLTSTMWNSATSFANHYTTASLKVVPTIVFLQISDDNTNRICRWSLDGQNFHTLHTIGRTDFLTADQVCFFVHSDNSTYPAGMTMLSWKQT